MALMNSALPRSSISAPTALEDSTSTMTSSPSSSDTHTSSFITSPYHQRYHLCNQPAQLYIMSSTPIGVLELGRHSQQESPSNCHECRQSELEGQSSSGQSSSESSQSISIHVNANNLQNTAHKFSQLEKEIKQLQSENQLLVLKNEELMSRLKPVKNSQRQLKRQLKEKQLQIMQLKNQLSINNYGMSNLSKSGYDSLASKHNPRFEEKKNKGRSKSKRKNTVKEESSAESSVSQEFNFDDHRHLRRQWQAQKLAVERQILELQEKVVICEEELKWSMSLVYKIINLGDKLAYLFKQKITDRKWSPKRQAKAVWRYLKHILSYLLLID